MFDRGAATQFALYHKARAIFLANPNILIRLEEYLAIKLQDILQANLDEIQEDYDQASLLYPFWKNYPPDHRGRQPIGDQYPWIEVGEHAVGSKLPRLLEKEFYVRDVGFPSGTDQRFVLKSQKIYEITKELTDSVWLFVDIKSVGPRDDAPHAVMSHNQVSGDGLWEKPETGVRNTVLIAKGQRSNHLFHCSLPPLFVLSDGTITPTIIFVIKPVYRMLSLNKKVQAGVEGQPLSRIGLASIPNGLLLTENPGYVKTYPGLFFPGKDDKGKNPLKVRARIDFDILEKIASWRYREIFIREEADQA